MAAPTASARSATIDLHPADRYGEAVGGEPDVGTAVVRFPRGHVESGQPLGAFWTARRVRGDNHDCFPRVFATGETMAKPVRIRRGDLEPGSLRRRQTEVTLEGGGLASPQRLAAEQVLAMGNAPRTLVGWVHVRLPDGVLPLFTRREVYVIVADWTGLELSVDCPRSERRAEAVLRSTLRGIRIQLPASYAPPPPDAPPPTLDLATGGGLELLGTRARDETGSQVAAAGDVNGDGLADALITSPYAGRRTRGAVYVVFGRAGGGTLPLASLAPGGFRIDGPVADGINISAAGIGDLDGDGMSEIAVGVPEAGRSHAGAVYVVRGKRDGTTVGLARREDVLFAIGAPDRCSFRYDGEGIGKRVAAAGDANGDGLGDIALLAPDDCGRGRLPEAVFVVYGKRTAGDVDLTQLGAAGLEVRASGRYTLSDAHLAGVGDTNGDGLADLVVGAVGYTYPDYAALLPGRAAGGTTTFARVPTRITSEFCSGVGDAVAGLGDVNGDGFADVGVGAPEGCADGVGRAYVLFGGPQLGPVDLDDPGLHGFAIAGTRGFVPGDAIAGAGDLNGDGLADLALGYRAAGAAGRRFAGAVIAVYGKRDTALVRIQSLGGGGLRWLGPTANAHLGDSVAGIGDFDGDGRPDLIAGLPRLRSFTGGAWVLPQP